VLLSVRNVWYSGCQLVNPLRAVFATRITADDDWIRIFGMLNYGVRHPISHHVVGVFKRDGSMVVVMTTMGWLI